MIVGTGQRLLQKIAACRDEKTRGKPYPTTESKRVLIRCAAHFFVTY